MPHFTEEQLKELEQVFDLKRINTLPVRDGRVRPTDQVWWRGAHGPELVSAEVHWTNIEDYPDTYSRARPKITYQD